MDFNQRDFISNFFIVLLKILFRISGPAVAGKADSCIDSSVVLVTVGLELLAGLHYLKIFNEIQLKKSKSEKLIIHD